MKAATDAAAAPLLATTDIRPPEGGRAAFVPGAGGSRMRIAIWKAGGRKKRGTVLLVHGLCECIEKHASTIGELLARGFDAVAFDLAGHGLSSDPPPERVRDFSAYDENLDAAIGSLRGRKLARPLLGLGHSMGGALLLAAAGRHSRAFAGIFLSAPMLGIRALESASFMQPLNSLLAALRYSPFFSFPKFVPHNYTSDMHARIHYQALLLSHPQLEPRVPIVPWCQGAIDYMERIADRQFIEAVSLPVAVAIAEAEVLVSNRQARSVAGDLRRGSLFEIAGAQHELLQERPELRDRMWQHIDGFFGSLAGGGRDARC